MAPLAVVKGTTICDRVPELEAATWAHDSPSVCSLARRMGEVLTRKGQGRDLQIACDIECWLEGITAMCCTPVKIWPLSVCSRGVDNRDRSAGPISLPSNHQHPILPSFQTSSCSGTQPWNAVHV